VERSEAAKTRRRGDRRSPFDRFVQTAHRGVSRTPFFVVCACIVATWLVSVPLWEDLKEWQTVIHTVASALTLLLVALLENASRRGGGRPGKAQRHRRGAGRADEFGSASGS
jgi:low affinity Fe/Cu permease